MCVEEPSCSINLHLAVEITHGEFILSATMSFSDKVFWNTTNTFSSFKSNSGYSENDGEMGDGPTHVYNTIALVMQVNLAVNTRRLNE